MIRRALSPLLSVTACVVAAAAARAEPPPASQATQLRWRLGEHLRLALPGEATFVAGHVDPIGVSAEDPDVGDTVGAERSAYLRLRLQPRASLTGPWAPFRAYRVEADLDVLRHYLAVGEHRDVLAYDPAGRVEAGFVGAHLQQLYALAAGERLALAAGLMRSGWGMGLLANPGEEPDPDGDASPFGYAVRADRVLRAQVAWSPLQRRAGASEAPLTVAVAADAVVDDDTATWADGDRAYHLVGAVRAAAGGFRGGVYVVHRRQHHGAGGDTTVTVLDGHGRAELVRTEQMGVWLEAELAGITGMTTCARSPVDPAPFDVAALGAVGRFGLERGMFKGVLEAGMASGDDNPFDDELHAFSFDREYRVGLLLFREVLRTASAVTAYNVADPTYRGAPPRGFEDLATGGAVRGASYVNPRLTLKPTPDLHLFAGFLYAASDGDYVDAFTSGLEGGAPVGPRGARGADALGLEVDLGVRYAFDLGEADAVRLAVRAEGGWCRPGEVFDDADGKPMDDVFGLWLNVGARW